MRSVSLAAANSLLHSRSLSGGRGCAAVPWASFYPKKTPAEDRPRREHVIYTCTEYVEVASPFTYVEEPKEDVTSYAVRADGSPPFCPTRLACARPVYASGPVSNHGITQQSVLTSSGVWIRGPMHVLWEEWQDPSKHKTSGICNLAPWLVYCRGRMQT